VYSRTRERTCGREALTVPVIEEPVVPIYHIKNASGQEGARGN
jgi:hypothetical protein